MFIGTKVQMEGFTGYSGGLDKKSGVTGKESIYTTYGQNEQKIEIMFHVSTLLLFQEDDPQKVERKRHIGNDVVVMIFKESNGPNDTVDVTSFVSHFNHVFIIVNPVKDGRTTRYRVTVVTKPPVAPFPPYIPKTGNIFNRDDSFRDWILKKCKIYKYKYKYIIIFFNFCIYLFVVINAERTAMEAPDFRGSLMNTRKTMLNEIIEVSNHPNKK